MLQGRVFPGLETFAVLRDSITMKGLRCSLGVLGTIDTPKLGVETSGFRDMLKFLGLCKKLIWVVI